MKRFFKWLTRILLGTTLAFVGFKGLTRWLDRHVVSDYWPEPKAPEPKRLPAPTYERQVPLMTQVAATVSAPTQETTSAPAVPDTAADLFEPEATVPVAQIVGNQNTHIYHDSTQKSYTSACKSPNAVFFDTETDAQAAGYRRAKR
ncbi:hypothetical protein IV38_GL000476 [Lactobacillus selangorensis]|uniref:Ada DNA repair metal-binding domain-containing protein n=1 Tax=Lactobacillus selangorensis TaxID=81857 RepID=A0A0R2FPL6_9LACO|nr:Ada metal-binding domain-containing protein [Lactobacillus selangorensis]KRN29590.1 hypothetical protein IV38_GL000476 [Lactobacillus selangorensis]KRN33880.1 hypothetical protein IV40_GL000192 [Lactobacillus selangorensis]